MADTNDPATYFLATVSAQTGIDPRVLFAWISQEGAYKRGGTAGFNYLNIKPFPGDKHTSESEGHFSQFDNVQDAAAATVTLLHAPQYKNILATARLKPSPKQQIAAIAASPWDQNHYDTKTPGNPAAGGPKLLDTFMGIFKKNTSTYLPPSQYNNMGVNLIPGTEGSIIGDIKGPSGIDVATGAAKDVAGFFSAPIDAINWVFTHWERVFLVIGGAIGLLVAIILLFKSQSGEKTFTFSRGE